MKKSTRTLLGTATAAALGALLILGGTGSLAFWSDSSTSATQEIQSGSLDLGTATGINLASAKIVNCASTCTTAVTYTGSPLVPGDTITGTATVPVRLVGANMRAGLTVQPTTAAISASVPADNALASAVSVTVKSIYGDNGTGIPNASRTVNLSPMDATIPVVFEVSLPSNAGNAAMGGRVSIVASYTLTQIGAA